MCGIAGWFTKPGCTWRPTKQQLAALYTEIESRGRDATGYGTIREDTGRLYVYKGPLEPKDFIEQLESKNNLPIGKVGLLHTRAASVGEPTENINNHPIPYKYENRSVIITHNGGIGNLEAAYKAMALAPPAEVDSALIACAMAKYGPMSGLKFLEAKSGGSAAFAALYEDGTLVLARNGNPLYLSQPAPGALVWSSCERQIQLMSADYDFGIPMFKVSIPKDGWFGIWDKNGELTAGEWRLPTMHAPPKWLRQQRAEKEREEREAREREAKAKLGFQQPPVVLPQGSGSPLSKKEEAKALLPKALLDAKPVAIPRNHHVVCHWQGCWKRAAVTRPFEGRFVPICKRHNKRVEKQQVMIVLAPSGEISRKQREGVIK